MLSSRDLSKIILNMFSLVVFLYSMFARTEHPHTDGCVYVGVPYFARVNSVKIRHLYEKIIFKLEFDLYKVSDCRLMGVTKRLRCVRQALRQCHCPRRRV